MDITISSHMDNYKSATIRTFARCLHIDTIAMFCIARHLEPQDAYMLARACRARVIMYPPALLLYFAENGWLHMIKWYVDKARTVAFAPNICMRAIAHDRVNVVAWAMNHGADMSDTWRDAAQKHNAVHTLAWMYCEVVSCLHDGNNYHV